MDPILEYSGRFGHTMVYRQNNELTVYCKVNENLYSYHQWKKNSYRPDEVEGEWETQEVNWNGYILGARTLRFDYQVDADEEVTKESVDRLITKDHDNDDVFSYHVERIKVPDAWFEMPDQELWDEQSKLHSRRGELEKELREVHRYYNMIWAFGDDRYKWADNL